MYVEKKNKNSGAPSSCSTLPRSKIRTLTTYIFKHNNLPISKHFRVYLNNIMRTTIATLLYYTQVLSVLGGPTFSSLLANLHIYKQKWSHQKKKKNFISILFHKKYIILIIQYTSYLITEYVYRLVLPPRHLPPSQF